MQKRYLERQSSKTHQGVNERQESRRGCSPISMVRHPYFSIVGIEMDAWRAVVEKWGGEEGVRTDSHWHTEGFALLVSKPIDMRSGSGRGTSANGTNGT